jgi:hypothetical protein
MSRAHDKRCTEYVTALYAGGCLAPCICPLLREAYREGYSDHARSQQHWQDTHGAYRAAPGKNGNATGGNP